MQLRYIIISLYLNVKENPLTQYFLLYRGADKSLARPTSLCILFDGENISFADTLVIYTGWVRSKKVKVKAVCGSYSTAALRHIALLPE